MSKREPLERKERLTIYRVRGDKVADTLIVKTDKAKPPVKLKIAHDDATLYVKNTSPRPQLPAWTQFLTENQDMPPDLFGGNRSEGAALVVRDLGDTFILSFGMGFHLVNTEMVERDFGLRITLNSVDPEKLRSLDKASFEDNWLNTRNQSPREADIFDLQIDCELDMVNAITGASNVAVFGSVVTERDALSISTAAKIDDLRAIFREAQARHALPLPEQFSWMDNVSKVKDPVIVELLDVLLEEALNTNPDSPSVWMGEPEIVDWELQAGYSFQRGQRAAIHPTLQLTDLLAHLRDQNAAISVESLKRHLVYANDANGECIRMWQAYRCLYAEIADNGDTHVLRDGVWHTVAQGLLGQNRRRAGQDRNRRREAADLQPWQRRRLQRRRQSGGRGH
ncbi:hypothetical protein BHUM_03922c [Candidatus Burkholderia humilis]|nr:hypothetical protein BHUM_03922c [Candidatus Burkholderia humilis]